MNRTLTIGLVSASVALLAACGGDGDDPADMYVGSWKSSCYSYVAVNKRTYFQTNTLTLSKASAESLAGTYSGAVAHSDSSCRNVLGNIPSPPSVTLQIGDKANVLGGEVDKITYTTSGGSRTGYMTANATQLFLVVTETPNQIPSGWGRASPYTKVAGKDAALPELSKSAGASDELTPANPLDANFR